MKSLQMYSEIFHIPPSPIALSSSAEHFEHSLQIKQIFTQQALDMNLIQKQHADVTISSFLVSLLSNPFQALTGLKEQTQRERNRDEGSYF